MVHNEMPALIDKANTDELFMLMSMRQLTESSNQLVKVVEGEYVSNACPIP